MIFLVNSTRTTPESPDLGRGSCRQKRAGLPLAKNRLRSREWAFRSKKLRIIGSFAMISQEIFRKG
jgi:hypothetical protein